MYPSSILRLTNFEWHKWRARLCPCCPCSIPGIPPHTQSLQLCRWPLVGHQQRPPAVPLGTLATCEGIRIKIKCNLSLDSWSFWPQHQVLHGSAALRLNPPVHYRCIHSTTSYFSQYPPSLKFGCPPCTNCWSPVGSCLHHCRLCLCHTRHSLRQPRQPRQNPRCFRRHHNHSPCHPWWHRRLLGKDDGLQDATMKCEIVRENRLKVIFESSALEKNTVSSLKRKKNVWKAGVEHSAFPSGRCTV